ncbi:S9 family peptidase [Leptothermofonsia sichuanensis E412]|uniref:S9 family peptidase n=1 Tax=Leptothermofonsia sichuanensis TaxID=2917832 RepID=UPI001CA7209D|nr:S9 family peptidase [Leptothermofonsia sichuanensis]QZZ21538.1 S9 family peptidase [Leptothermofonsia sichuanensis E412]
MAEPRIAPYGSWKSPITSELIVAGTIGLGQVRLDGEVVYWSEQRPTEAGRNVIVRLTPDGQMTDVTPPPFNVRTRVHEYGGGSYTVYQGTVYFSNFADQRLYRHKPGEEPVPITPEQDWRYADGVIDGRRQRMICVREDHTGSGEAVNTLVSLSLDSSDPEQTILVAGSDFYSSPRLSPDGSLLAWLCWNHPNMPWDGTELWVGEVSGDGSIGARWKVAGGSEESIVQPEWSPDGALYFISDRTNWWNLYRWQGSRGVGDVEPLCPMDAEFGFPHWIFGMSNYAFESAELLICTYSQEGISYLATLNPQTRQLEPVKTPYTNLGEIHASPGQVVFSAGSATSPGAIAQLHLESGQIRILRRSSNLEIDPGYLSEPRAIAFPTENGLTAYGIFYPPKNRDYVAPEGERPPLLVKIHGGPTAATSTAFNLRIQYWTSRGIAVLDVNYGGSTGYGREYRERLKGNWGIVDVDDCVNGARYLADRGEVDGNRLVIDGGSAGGYTILAALTFRDTFKAGASFYGVSDLEVLATDTHKFESRYLDSLIGPYPECKDLYVERSPIHFTDRLNCPIIFFQGDEDKIVPPNQAERMVNALRNRGLPVAYVLYEGEQHGFRKAENIRRTIDGEFYFYSKVFGFAIADPLEPVAIDNL